METPMDESERYDAGLKVRKQILGEAHVEKSLASRNPFNEEFQDLITRYAWGEIWTRDRLSHDTRRFLVLAITAGMGRWEEFRLHMRAALQGGVAPDDIKEVLLQIAIYAGVPAANTGFHIAQEVMKELGSA
jgi:4-carboxymuconolactone decarboxylase